MAMGTTGPFRPFSQLKGVSFAYVEGTVNNAADLANVVDEGNVLCHTTPPAYVAVGIQRFTFREQYRCIMAIPVLEDTTANIGIRTCATTDGSAATNVCDVQAVTVAAGALAPVAYTAADRTLKVLFILVR